MLLVPHVAVPSKISSVGVIGLNSGTCILVPPSVASRSEFLTTAPDLINALRSLIASETYVLRLFLLTISANRTPPE